MNHVSFSQAREQNPLHQSSISSSYVPMPSMQPRAPNDLHHSSIASSFIPLGGSQHSQISDRLKQ